MTSAHTELVASVDAATSRRRANTEATTAALMASALRDSMTVSGDGRVTEKDAAKLLGYSAGFLKVLRLGSNGPVHFTVGMNGCRVSYRIEHLAAWIEMGREV